MITNPYDGPRQPGRVGIPFPGVEVRIGDKDEVLLKGGQVFKGYWRNEAATKETFTPDGFFMTGDVGEIGEDGTVAIRGRLKELIISGGFNVFPREIEDVLGEHPAVSTAAVIGVPDDKWGEAVRALVVLRPGAKADAAELTALVRDRKGPVCTPKSVEFVDSLPLTVVGKVDKKVLRARYWEGRDRQVG